MGFSLISGAGIDGNAPYQAKELQITTLANPGKQANLLFNLFQNWLDCQINFVLNAVWVCPLTVRKWEYDHVDYDDNECFFI